MKAAPDHLLFSKIFNELPVATVVFFKKRGAKPMANAAARRLFGKQLSAVTKPALLRYAGKKLLQYPRTELPWRVALSRGAGVEKDDLVMRLGGPPRASLAIGGKKEHVARLRVLAMPLRDGNNIVAAVTTFEDSTKQLDLENDLYRRTIRLEIANEHLKDLDRAKTEFVSLASHQLKTPLTAVRWFMELVMEGDAGPLNAKQREYLGDANHAVLRLIELMNFLLNVSRIETGKLAVHPHATDVVEATKGIIREAEPLFAARAQLCTFHATGRLPMVSLDEKILREVLLNLLSNAAKYSLTGKTIEVRLSKKKDVMCWEVKDEGYGIPEIEQSHLFAKFFRASNVLHYETEGTGLGLYLAKSLVELCGGKLWFASKENAGSTFSFTLPLAGIEPRRGEKPLAEYPKIIPTYHHT